MRLEISVIFSALILASCGNWPFDSDTLQSRFLENEEAFEELDTMIRESGNVSVEVPAGSDSLWVKKAEGFQIEIDTSEQASIWVDRLRETNTHRLIGPTDQGGAVLFEQWSNGFSDNQQWVVAIVYEENGSDQLLECESDFREIACGVCGWRMGEGWSLIYHWEPHVILPDEYEDYMDGELSLDDYMTLKNSAMLSCRNEGHSAIGYDSSEY